ncbi:MAG: nucleotidyltransferase domain-containing protein [Planctomycetes bacterium]|nr:nucleotidyltransferase domain-containing protein [Planctomycetota bacterium]
MATTPNEIIKIVKRYVVELEKNHITIRDAIIFGSHTKGAAQEWSDIDVALVSPAFTGDRFDDRRRIVPLRRKIDNRIEPIPFRPEDFDNGETLAEEIKRTGTRIALP